MTDPTPVVNFSDVELTERGFPFIRGIVTQTADGVPYLKSLGLALISKPDVDLSGLQPFLNGYAPELEFVQYLGDPTPLPSAAQLCKVAGQNCYASWGPRRSRNDQAAAYFDNLESSGHGSVLEHANFSFHVYGISRNTTHEQVRHRAGFAYSQLSQRYVTGKVLRFVERPEYQANQALHARFEAWIGSCAAEYDLRSEMLLHGQKEGSQILSADARTDRRKKVQQTARSILPNETEATMVVTGNVRAWRHFIEMRANPHAETEIRAFAFAIYKCLVAVEPILFGDYVVQTLDDDTLAVSTPYRKV